MHGAPSRLDGGDLELRPAPRGHAVERPMGHVAGDALEVGVGDHVDRPDAAPALDAQVDLIRDAGHAAARELLLEALELGVDDQVHLVGDQALGEQVGAAERHADRERHQQRVAHRQAEGRGIEQRGAHGSGVGAQHVARAAYGVDQRVVGVAIDRLPQAADVYVDEIALRVEVQIPHALEQHGARHDLSGAAHEKFQQLQLPRRELHLAPAARHPPGQQVELQVLDLQARGVGRAGAAAQQRFDARQQFRERERLGEIVVATGLEPADAVIHAAERGQHQYRSQDTLSSHQLDDRKPVDVRQHAVGHDEVELPFGGTRQPFAPVGGMIDTVAALAQAFDQKARGLAVVLDEQYVHLGDRVGAGAAAAQESPGTYEAGVRARSALCRRAISALRNTRLNRSWQDADTCSSNVELTFSTVTAAAARMVAVRLAPGT